MSFKNIKNQPSQYSLHRTTLVSLTLICLLLLTACQIVIDPTLLEPAPASASEAMPAEEMAPLVSTATVHLFPANGENDVAGTTSTLERYPDRVRLTIDTVDLVPGEAYTLWWVVFNNPEACATVEGQCVGPDFTNADTVSMVSYGGGVVADEEGRLRFDTVLMVDDTTGALDNTDGFPFELLEPAPGLLNPLTAEIHGAIRTHGAAMDDPTAQLGSFNDDCNPECMNVQAVMHLPSMATE